MHTIFITGANRGIGLEFVRQYLENGDHVIATCRHPDQAAELHNLKKTYGDHLGIYSMDLEDFQSIERVARQLNGRPLDFLINNGGILLGSGEDLAHLDYSAWEKTFRINVLGPVKVTSSLLENVKKGKKKKIVHLSSAMGSCAENSSGGEYQYRSSKSALNQAMRSLHHELIGDDILTCCLHPGWVKTDMGGPHALIDPETSVKGMREVIQKLDPSKAGGFYRYNGETVAW